MPTLSRITKELLETYNRRPRKRLGQHFLIDPKVVERIIAAAELTKDDLAIEIGSGLGVITAEIAAHAGKLVAIEYDKELVEISKKILAPCKNVTIVSGDILDLEFSCFSPGYKVIGNLPYNITAPIVEKILTAENKPERAVIMVQKEVAERMSASPGSKKYGSFSIFTQFYASVSLISLVSRSSFLPWPEVSSAIVKLAPYKEKKFPVKDEKRFFAIVHAAFQQRRKKLRNSLQDFDLKKSGIDLNRRPETLSIAEFAALAE
jgi:16S rRNA (adenine1518-N6/adenine1519-N6)-dimethyltransferase